jgi:hypothetical protein
MTDRGHVEKSRYGLGYFNFSHAWRKYEVLKILIQGPKTAGLRRCSFCPLHKTALAVAVGSKTKLEYSVFQELVLYQTDLQEHFLNFFVQLFS